MFFFSEKNNSFIKPKSVEHAYLAILSEDLKSAEIIFEKLNSPRANWGITLTGILSGFVTRYPTYFEIRNFLEIDLDFLIKNEKLDYIELLLGSSEILSEINQETYKYIARVMMENNFLQPAKEYLDKSKSIYYNDVELHFLFAKYYIEIKEYFNANLHIQECLRFLPDYYPAKTLAKEILKYLA